MNPSRGIWVSAGVFGAAAAVVSVLSEPRAKALRRLEGLGLSEDWERLLLHSVPVAVTVLAVLIGGELALRANRGGTKTLYRAGSGLITGFVLSLCLEAFARLGPWLSGFFGPLRLDHVSVVIGWAEVAVFLLIGARLFGKSALEVMNIGPVPEHQMPATTKEWADNDRAGASLVAMGLGLACVLLSVQAVEASLPVRVVLAGAALVGFAVSSWISWLLYRLMDEAMRLVVVRAYALSAVAASAIFTAWTLAASFPGVAAPSALDTLVLLILLQWISMAPALKSTFGASACDVDEASLAVQARR